MVKYWVLRVSGRKRSELAPPSSLIRKGWNVKLTTERAKNDSQKKIFGFSSFKGPSALWKLPNHVCTQVHKCFRTEIRELFCPNVANSSYGCVRQMAIFSGRGYPHKNIRELYEVWYCSLECCRWNVSLYEHCLFHPAVFPFTTYILSEIVTWKCPSSAVTYIHTLGQGKVYVWKS